MSSFHSILNNYVRNLHNEELNESGTFANYGQRLLNGFKVLRQGKNYKPEVTGFEFKPDADTARMMNRVNQFKNTHGENLSDLRGRTPGEMENIRQRVGEMESKINAARAEQIKPFEDAQRAKDMADLHTLKVTGGVGAGVVGTGAVGGGALYLGNRTGASEPNQESQDSHLNNLNPTSSMTASMGSDLNGMDDSMSWLKYAIPGAIATGAGALYLRKKLSQNK